MAEDDTFSESLLEPLLGVPEFANPGCRAATIYGWRCRGQGPPGLHVARHLRYRRGDVDA